MVANLGCESPYHLSPELYEVFELRKWKEKREAQRKTFCNRMVNIWMLIVMTREEVTMKLTQLEWGMDDTVGFRLRNTSVCCEIRSADNLSAMGRACSYLYSYK